ncbi:MAG: fibronectin type III domain-containing protein [Clostridia bacterium]|nr:fibronectin type III domain-containing protein [Clostridia bacterium]
MKKLLSILLAVTMLLAMGSGLVLFTSSATEYVKMPMPGFNQYTPEQMGKMAKRVGYSGAEDYEYGSNWVFTKDDDGHTIISVDIPATGDNYNGYKVAFATADKYDQWRQNKLIDGLSPFGDVDMSNKLGFKFKIVNVGDVAFTGNIGFCFGSSTKRVAVDFRAADKEGDYYVVRFAKTGWYGYTTVGASWYYDCPTLEDTYYGVIDQFQIYFENDASMAGKRLSFYFDDFHAYGSVDSTELGKAIVAAKAADLDDTLIASAEEIYKAAEDHTQAEIDKAAKKLTDTIDEIKYGYEKYKDELDNLLTVADDLGFFDSTYENYEAISDADMVFANAASTLDELMNNVRIVRGCIAEEVMDGDLLTAFIKCNNAWKYNYTDASFKALTTAIDEVSAEFIYGGLSKGVALGENDAAALLNTAYQGLVALPVRANTANFFAGWTTTKVNDVVDANSGRLCDSIGDGKNTKDIWNNGDFSNNTLFEADDNFVMTALADFTGKSMGWKNMDRSKTLQPNDNGAFPPIDVTGLNDSYGIRFKLEVEGGSVERLLIGLSNCSDMMKEDYARYISPDCVDAEGYINIPFSYFETAWWTAEKGKFNSDDREKIIVLIIEAYGVEEDTVITMSDFTGYQLLEKATQEDVAKLEGVVNALKAFDIDGRYADIVAAAEALDPDVNYTADYDEVYEQANAVLSDYKDPTFAIVDVPGYSIYEQEELDLFPVRGGNVDIVKEGDGIRATFTGSYRFWNGTITYPNENFPNTGYGPDDCDYGELVPINDKTLKEMLGGYDLTQIIAYRFKIDGGGAYVAVNYKDGIGLWSGMVTKAHTVYMGSDGYFTFNIADTPTAKFDGWYGGNGYNQDLQAIREHAKYIGFDFDPAKNTGKLIHGWQVILYESIDRSELKEALTTFADLGLASYDDALATYYNKDATETELKAAADQLVKDATPDAPSAPVLEKVTYNSVTLQPGAKNIEFRCNDGEWTSLNVFENLDPDTEYSFYARIMAIGVHPASEPSKALVVRTAKAPLAGEITIEGEAVYGKTLTANAAITSNNPGELSYVWSRATALEAVQVGTGATYTVVKEDIGATLSVSVTAANLEGSLASESTAEVTKAKPEIITPPANTVLMIGDKLGNANIAGAVVDVEGAWSWVEPELIPDLTQSGSEFDVLFTPVDTDCYEIVAAKVTVTITSNTSEKVVTDAASGISLKGEFLAGADPVMTVTDITAAKPAYIALLRAARNSESANNLILFKNVSFSSQCYVGKLELSAQVSPSRAGQEYTVWFFANGEVCSSTGTVDAYGVITVSDFVADIA